MAALTALLASAAAAAAAAPHFGGDHGLPRCAEPGCLYGASGVAVDPANGDVYVAEEFNNRVSKFKPSGVSASGEPRYEFVDALGYGVRDGADELQTCTTATGCLSGIPTGAPGGFDLPSGIVTDSSGDLYVADLGNHRVEEFGPSGEFVLMFGGGVDQGPHHPGGLCTAAFVAEGDTCGAGTVGNGPGQIGEWFPATIALGGPEPSIYLGDKARIDVFQPSGAFKEQVSLAGLSSSDTVHAISVAPTGDMFVQVGQLTEPGQLVHGVHEFAPNGIEVTTFDSAGFGSSLAMNGSDLYVADPEGGLQILGYHTSPEKHFQSFDPELGPQTSAFGVNGITYTKAVPSGKPTLYMTGENFVWVVPAPPPGPLLKQGSQASKPGPRGEAVVEANINPEGNSTSCSIEYVIAADYAPSAANPYSAGASVQCEPANLGEGFSYVHTATHLKGLVPGGVYHWRVVASNAEGTLPGAEQPSPDQEFDELPPALVEGPWADEVSAASATLLARINPLGAGTSYRLEYGTTTSYGQVLTGNVGAGEAYVEISHELTGLQPHTTYHYRLVTESSTGTVETADHVFVTQLIAPGSTLPDARAWEQVSPIEKHGAGVIFEAGVEDVQASASGDSVSYIVNSPITDEPHTATEALTVISTRGEGGWTSVEPMPGKTLPEGPVQADELLGLEFPAPLSSTDLSQTVIEPSPYVKPLSPETTERTLYLYDRATGGYTPIVNSTDDETGSSFGGRAPANWMQFRGATPDLSHIVFESPYALTKGSIPAPDLQICEKDELCSSEENLYEWSEGHLRLIDVLPNGKSTVNAFLGRGQPGTYGIHAVSTDGRWIVWTLEQQGSRPVLYVRDMVYEKTYQVGGKEAVYETMSAEGSRVFYLEGGDLHALDTATQSDVDITPHGAGEEDAGVQDAILGASEDGQHVYVVATGDLTGSQQNGQGAAAQPGKPNAYALHDTGSGWSVKYVATLSSEDEHDWSARPLGEQELMKTTSHVSPNGRWLAFMSNRSLTGYDNVDALSGVPDEEVFLYDSQTERLLCASCNPTGGRPHGILDEGGKLTLVDAASAWEGHWLAGSMPGWRPARASYPMYQPRVLLDSGRLYFQSSDALAPQDTNGREDVYQYEPVGVGGSGGCTEQSPSFSSSSAGCVNLISSGASSQESVFYDASPSGDDVFFSTSAKLSWSDIDEATDVYDARVGGGFPEPLKSPPCEGDACQGQATSPIDQTPSSLTFQGPGNLPSAGPKIKPKSKCRKGFAIRHGRCVKKTKHKKARKSHRRSRHAKARSRKGGSK